jgi:hypothetical protein
VPSASIYHATTAYTNWVTLLCHAMQLLLKACSVDVVEKCFRSLPSK